MLLGGRNPVAALYSSRVVIERTPRPRRPRGRPPHPDILTPAEWAVLRAVHRGLNNAEIAHLRGSRPDTVKGQVASIVGKLRLADRDALRRWQGIPLDDDYGIDLRSAERKRRMSTTTVPGTVTGVAPMFLVDDVARTAEWYRDRLGFEIGEYFREDHGPHNAGDHDHPALGEAIFVIVSRDGQRVMFGRTEQRGHGVHSNHDFKHVSPDAYFWVDGVEELFAHLKHAGDVAFIYELELMSYGLAEFGLKDCDGRLLTFGGPPRE